MLSTVPVLLRVILKKKLQKFLTVFHYYIVIGFEKDLYPDSNPKKNPDPDCHEYSVQDPQWLGQ